MLSEKDRDFLIAACGVSPSTAVRKAIDEECRAILGSNPPTAKASPMLAFTFMVSLSGGRQGYVTSTTTSSRTGQELFDEIADFALAGMHQRGEEATRANLTLLCLAKVGA